jgi:hemerythrin-like domain-containing protein
MKPRGPLMWEHRLIEQLIKGVEKVIPRIDPIKGVAPVFIDTIVDFFRVYADRTHHGKEEDILFKALEKKPMSPEDQAMMQELVEDHRKARAGVGDLVSAKEKYLSGNVQAIETIKEKLNFLIGFYPGHILKEDKIFFLNTEKYFSPAELDELLNQFYKFDQGMIHEKYRNVVAGIIQS